jgi:predicted GIY-YIG superfamily endonuclease
VYFVYIVRCADASLYTGFARDPEERMAVHNSGKGAKYTASRLPVTLVYKEPCASRSSALKRECEIKSWNRAKKEALIGPARTAGANLRAARPADERAG